MASNIESSRSLPNSTPCLSYWQRTTRAYPNLHANIDTTVPSSSKYVIVGSGISGGLTAFKLIEGGAKPEDIVIIEAREAASGASSRNAGHVRPDAFRGFSAYAKVHGEEQALKIIQDERLVLEKVDSFVKEHNVECDFNLTTTFDVCMTPEFAAYEAESLEAFKKAGGDTSHVAFYEGDEAKEKTRVPGAVAAYEWPAGSSHPAKLAQFLLQAVMSKGAKLFTFCPATEIERSDAPEIWKVYTPRGIIEAEKIIHCTNAHAALLLPQLESYIRPNRAQAHSLVPVPAFSAQKVLQNTFSLRFSLLHFYSLIQRKGDGTLVLGVSRSNPTMSPETKAGQFSTDDSRYNDEIAQDALRTFSEIFPAYSSQAIMHGEGLDHAWTGIIAMTTDSVPFIGSIDSLPGQYLCAGFNGHGMARIFTCAPAVAQIVLGKTYGETGLPECFRYSDERLARLSNGELPSIW
ncbi:FAD dependent oxidoreductase [Penicillium cf. griseofulvum]|uniref:FAD dependent oxidoreductase n=1 Tax=Penicillium cf. griseofulvum TaxID=2972120 RepID=A0A9W9MG49_9EURO|nr:FAD dependent oxidoreductase [Penicillium cf. griseofulvum]KAJ5423299.1 FAD dependent oxidoreductase [Penicillium cf. griseofulvum]KAJ5431428.1 FAD dependent oxidoreductase [Penicillium cf. griseofulvum]